jgi:hypothetical protein
MDDAIDALEGARPVGRGTDLADRPDFATWHDSLMADRGDDAMTLRQDRNEGAADEAAGAGDEDLRHRAMIPCGGWPA